MIMTKDELIVYIKNNFTKYLSNYLRVKKSKFILRDVTFKDETILVKGYYTVDNGDTITCILGLRNYTDCGVMIISNVALTVSEPFKEWPLDNIIGVKESDDSEKTAMLRLIFPVHVFIKSINGLYKDLVYSETRRNMLLKADTFALRSSVYINSLYRMSDVKELELKLSNNCWVGSLD